MRTRQPTAAPAGIAVVAGALALALAGCAGSAGAATAAPPTVTAATTVPTTTTVTSTSTATVPAPAPATETVTSTSTRTATAATTTTVVADPRTATLRAGDSGPAVAVLQERLSALGYWLGPADGNFGPLTTQAVYALQKAAGISRDGVVGPNTRAALDAGTRPSPRGGGDAVEIDLDRQLLLVVRGGEVTRILSTSTGTFEEYTSDGRTYLADTPRGTWQVGWAIDGTRTSHLGELYRPRYFHEDGIAVHGADSVPPWPASHGCARVTDAAISMIWREDLMPIGSTVRVY